MRAEDRGLSETHRGRITHQVADSAMLMRGGVVDILTILNADEVRGLRWIIETAVPTRETAATTVRDIEFLVFSPGQRLQSLIDALLSATAQAISNI